MPDENRLDADQLDYRVLQIAKAKCNYIQIVALYNQIEVNKELVRNAIKNKI